ncbi:HAD family hydrolase [bacterium]|nr:MAG: HAD family hydrolase [bacterium]
MTSEIEETPLTEMEKRAPEIADANASPLVTERGENIVVAPKAAPDFSRVRGIYFDLDDTLCGYWDATKAGLRAAFASDGPEGFTPQEMVVHWAAAFREFGAGLKASHWYAKYLKNGGITRTEQMRLTLERIGIVDDALAQRLSDVYGRERNARLVLFDDANETLDTLSGFPLGLITNGPADVQRQEVATVGIGERFAHFFIEGEVGFGKPEPEVFRRAAEAMGLQPGQLLMVGNSYHHDIVPALEAGWKAIWIRRPSDVPPSANNDALPEEMPEGGLHPDAIVGSLAEVSELLAPAIQALNGEK